MQISVIGTRRKCQAGGTAGRAVVLFGIGFVGIGVGVAVGVVVEQIICVVGVRW